MVKRVDDNWRFVTKSKNWTTLVMMTPPFMYVVAPRVHVCVCVCGGFRTFGITQNHAIYVIRIQCNSTLEELPFFCSQQNEGWEREREIERVLELFVLFTLRPSILPWECFTKLALSIYSDSPPSPSTHHPPTLLRL